MPYGNKNLHFGHIAGVFVPADFFARFLRDRIGARERPASSAARTASARPSWRASAKLVEAERATPAPSTDYVRENHDAQKARRSTPTASASTIYSGSGLEPCRATSTTSSSAASSSRRLYERGHAARSAPRCSSMTHEAQHVPERPPGHGPLPRAGLQVREGLRRRVRPGPPVTTPEELIAPQSSQLTGTVPELRPVENWYFDLPAFGDAPARAVMAAWEADPQRPRRRDRRPSREFLGAPVIYIQNDAARGLRRRGGRRCPPTTLREPEGQAAASTIDVRGLARPATRPARCSRPRGRALPHRQGACCRSASRATSTGACPPRPSRALEGLTVWCWPESAVGAHQSFTHGVPERPDRAAARVRRRLARLVVLRGRRGLPVHRPGQPVLLRRGAAGAHRRAAPRRPHLRAWGAPVRQTRLVANHHILFRRQEGVVARAP